VPVVTAAELSREFEPDALAVSQARRFLRQALQDLLGDDDGSELADTLLMAANELTTNAVLHARTEFVVRIAVDALHVRVEVTDGNSRVPQPCLARPTRPPAAVWRSSTAAAYSTASTGIPAAKPCGCKHNTAATDRTRPRSRPLCVGAVFGRAHLVDRGLALHRSRSAPPPSAHRRRQPAGAGSPRGA